MEKGAGVIERLRRVVRNRPWSYNFLVPFESGLRSRPSNLTSPRLSRNLLGNRFGLQELEQVIRAARFGIRSRHIEPTKRMGAPHGARALAIDVQVAHEELLARLADFLPVVGVNRARQSIFGIVRQFQRMIEIARLGHRQHRTKNLLLEDTSL